MKNSWMINNKRVLQILTIASIVVTLPLNLYGGAAQEKAKRDFTKFVNPFVGTDFHGHTFPGATYPFGMVQLSPDTRLTGWDGCSGYHYSDSTIYGFSHTHLSGTGCSDYGDVLLMPVSGYKNQEIIDEEYKSKFSHKNEVAKPGYYSVYLDKWQIKAELTSGRRVGMHRYQYRPNAEQQIIIDLRHRDKLLASSITQEGKSILKGRRRSKAWASDQDLYYYIVFSKPIKEVKSFDNNRAIITFETNGDDQLLAKIGISSVSETNAKLNLDAEVKAFKFDAILESSKEAWNDYLSKIEVTTDNQEERKTFYTALYHTAISPNVYSDVNGEYRGMDGIVHKAIGYERYSVFSLWDTYRALHPLFTIIEQKRTIDFIKSFLSIYNEAGKLPIWELWGNETNCMIGYHSVPVIVDAYVKGIKEFDTTAALEAMISSSNRKEYGIDLLEKYGGLPAEKEHESVSKTLEYAYDDWCIARFAELLGRTDVSDRYIKRAQFYKNVFDPQSGFMRPKLNGRWLTPFNPTEVNFHFIEANSWQYSFYVPQDVQTHISMLEGDEKYTSKLDEQFNASNKTTGRTQVDITGLIGQYAHGNEPSHHAAYLYNFAGKPWKTQETVRKIMKTLYSNAPDGLCGNDDCGQMSAWYVLSAAGFYPVTPGTTDYILGSPIFRKVIFHLENGKSFTIVAQNCDEKNLYIHSATINGAPYSKSYITHNQIIEGSTLNLEMKNIPSANFGVSISDRPITKINQNKEIVMNPWIEYNNHMFKDSTKVEIKSIGASKILIKTEDGEQIYSGPFTIKDDYNFAAIAIGRDGSRSYPVECNLKKIKTTGKIKLYSQYNRQYSAGGDEGLIDGIRGEGNFRLGGWQGYQNCDFEADIDLGKQTMIKRVGAGFLRDVRSWIWFPVSIEIYTSNNGLDFELSGKIENTIDPKDYEISVKDFVIEKLNKECRYIKIKAKNFGTIPSWHEGAGGEGFIFIDEIFFE